MRAVCLALGPLHRACTSMRGSEPKQFISAHKPMTATVGTPQGAHSRSALS